jgi:hypothetical protein
MKKESFRKVLNEAFSKIMEDQDRVRRHEDGYGDDLEEDQDRVRRHEDGYGDDLEEAPEDFLTSPNKPGLPSVQKRLPRKISGKGSDTSRYGVKWFDQQFSGQDLADALGVLPPDMKKRVLQKLGVDPSTTSESVNKKKINEIAPLFTKVFGRDPKQQTQPEKQMPGGWPGAKAGSGGLGANPNVDPKTGMRMARNVDKQTGQRKPFLSAVYDPISDQDTADMQMERSKEAEQFILKNKAKFKKQYGNRWQEVLYATANKMFENDSLQEVETERSKEASQFIQQNKEKFKGREKELYKMANQMFPKHAPTKKSEPKKSEKK